MSDTQGVITRIEKLRFLTYNIFMRPPAPLFTHNVENDMKSERLLNFVDNYLDKYDIICLQEMFGSFSKRRKELIHAAVSCGFKWHVCSPQTRSQFYLVDGGCVILSRYPILASSSTVFEAAGINADRFAAKGVIYSFISLNDESCVHVFNTHMQATYNDEMKAMTQEIRNSQLRQMCHFIGHCVLSSETTFLSTSKIPIKGNVRPGCLWPIILSGDFNCNSRATPFDGVSGTSEYDKLLDAIDSLGRLYVDVAHSAHGEHPVTYGEADIGFDGKLIPKERALTVQSDYEPESQSSNQSLDYIFYFPSKYDSRFVPGNDPLHPLLAHVSYRIFATPVGSSTIETSMSTDSIDSVEKFHGVLPNDAGIMRPIVCAVNPVNVVAEGRIIHHAHKLKNLTRLSDHLALDATFIH